METITYKGKEYPIRFFRVNWKEEEGGDQTHRISVSVESLSEALILFNVK